MVKSCDQIRHGKKRGSREETATTARRIATERLEWRRRSKPNTERPLEQAVEVDFNQTWPVAARELDAVRRLLGDELDLFLRSLSGH